MFNEITMFDEITCHIAEVTDRLRQCDGYAYDEETDIFTYDDEHFRVHGSLEQWDFPVPVFEVEFEVDNICGQLDNTLALIVKKGETPIIPNLHLRGTQSWRKPIIEKIMEDIVSVTW